MDNLSFPPPQFFRSFGGEGKGEDVCINDALCAYFFNQGGGMYFPVDQVLG